MQNFRVRKQISNWQELGLEKDLTTKETFGIWALFICWEMTIYFSELT